MAVFEVSWQIFQNFNVIFKDHFLVFWGLKNYNAFYEALSRDLFNERELE